MTLRAPSAPDKFFSRRGRGSRLLRRLPPRFVAEADPQCISDSPELRAAMPSGPLRTCTKVTSRPYLRK